MKKLLLILLSLAFVVACAPKQTVQPETVEEPAAEEETVQLPETEEREVIPQEEATYEEVASKYMISGRYIVDTATGEKLMEVASALCPGSTPADSTFNNIYFDFDKYEIKPEGAQLLRQLSAWLQENTDFTFYIEGHCDERGTNEYNLGLGDKRATSTKDFLISAGVPASRVSTISCGEEKPICTGSSEACWWQNRRAHFVVIK